MTDQWKLLPAPFKVTVSHPPLSFQIHLTVSTMSTLWISHACLPLNSISPSSGAQKNSSCSEKSLCTLVRETCKEQIFGTGKHLVNQYTDKTRDICSHPLSDLIHPQKPQIPRSVLEEPVNTSMVENVEQVTIETTPFEVSTTQEGHVGEAFLKLAEPFSQGFMHGATAVASIHNVVQDCEAIVLRNVSKRQVRLTRCLFCARCVMKT